MLVETQRKFGILRLLVDDYVAAAEPVGSEALREAHCLSWSPATIRNDFYELEDEGYLAKPHVSGGRIPTHRAYRWLRDGILAENTELERRWDVFKSARISPASFQECKDRCHAAARLLADATDHLAFCGMLDEENFAEAGLASLVKEPEFADQNAIAGVAEFAERMFDEAEIMIGRLLQKELAVYIGEESNIPQLKHCSFVLATYRSPDHLDHAHGFIGILGPARMPYERNVVFLRQIASAMEQSIG